MMKFIVALFCAKRTVATIVSNLENIRSELLGHADGQDAKASEHSGRAAEHLALRDVALAELTKARAVAENIGKLIEG